MKITDFTEMVQVVRAIDKLENEWADRHVSDLIDAQQRQYVDLVMEGGGVLGIALAGYTYALEKVGIRFLGVGGTSAGAINALLVAALDRPSEPKSGRVLEILAELDMFKFVDGDRDAKDFVKTLVQGAGTFKLAWKAFQVIDNMREDLGLCPGDYFLHWLEDNLADVGITTVGQLEARLRDLPPDLCTRNGEPVSVEEADPKLAVIAADVSTGTKVEFPKMADLYFEDPQGVNPARMVRASMSIPAFFHPHRIRNIPQGEKAALRWRDQAGYKGELPRSVYFVDGGIMSNFPIDVFHQKDRVPIAPTFGVKLGMERSAPRRIERPSQLMGAVFDSARHTLDYDFIKRNPDYQKLVAWIPTGEHNWLNFFMEPEDKVDLFRRGVETAVGFLLGFDWDDYKKKRKELLGQ